MDNPSLTLEIEPRQDSNQIELTAGARRLLLGASLRLLGHRFSRGQLILRDDLLRAATLADDAPEGNDAR